MRAALLIVSGSLVGACHFASCDPEALLAAQAGPGARACGAVDDLSSTVMPLDARACVATARADGAPWWVSIDQGVADGRRLTGFADDGARVIEVDYEAVYSMGIGGDDEQVYVSSCGAFGDRGPRCGTIAGDLCFLCGAPAPLDLTCP